MCSHFWGPPATPSQGRVYVQELKPVGGPNYRPYFELRLNELHIATAEVGELHSCINAQPLDEAHKLTMAWRSFMSQGCTATPHPGLIADICDKATPLLARVSAGHRVVWNGSNYLGQLTEDARDASLDLDRLISESDWARDD